MLDKDRIQVEQEPGRCVSCGFLSKLTRTQGTSDLSVFYEVHWAERRSGKLFKHGETKTMPVCYRQVPEFYIDLVRAAEEHGKLDPAGVIDVIYRDRSCPKWIAYEVDRAPKEHLQKVEMLDLEQRGVEFERQLESERREWEHRLEQQRRQFEGDLAEWNQQAEERRHRIILWLAAAAVIFAVFQVAAAILALNQDSWFVKLLGLD